MNKRVIIFLFLFRIIVSVSAQKNSIDYFGQNPPGDSAVIFAPGIISLPDRMESRVVFSPDATECYFIICERKENKPIYKIFYTKYLDLMWTEQAEVPFSVNQNVSLCNFSADGKTLYLNKDNDIWKVKRTKSGWSEPQRLPSPINSDSNEGGYAETADGAIYFYSNRAGSLGNSFDIWRIPHISNQSLQAENLGPTINSGTMQVTPCIAPDESYLIFAQPVNGSFKLFVSFNKGNNKWTDPVNLDKNGAGINILNQVDPTLSPDGKYLFFNRHAGNPTNIMDIYWVSTKIIDGIKKEIFDMK